MTTLDHYDFCKPYISDNEYILWEGAPEKGFTFTSRDLVMIPFSLFWLAFALFWEFSAITSTSSLFMAIWGTPICWCRHLSFVRTLYPVHLSA